MQPKMGGKFHLKLNIGTRPIANKYCEGKMKSTLKRESKVRETVIKEAIEVSSADYMISDQPETMEIVRLLGKGGVVHSCDLRVNRGFHWEREGREKVACLQVLQL
jgi:hypothetical protein